MERKSLSRMPCPIARSLERVGEWWSMLIMRDALHGYTRFDQFQQSLGIAPNMLTRRLTALVDAGLLARRRYSEHPPRDEYVPISILGDRFAIDFPPKLFTASLFVASCMGRDFKRITEWPALAIEFVFPIPLKKNGLFEQSEIKPASS